MSNFLERVIPVRREKLLPYETALTLGGGVLVVYPFCILANVMSFAGHRDPNDEPGWLLSTTASSFLWGSTAYPLIYFPCLLIAWMLWKNERVSAARWTANVPVLYLAALLVLMFAWSWVGRLEGR